jgi:hypothetical protein
MQAFGEIARLYPTFYQVRSKPDEAIGDSRFAARRFCLAIRRLLFDR